MVWSGISLGAPRELNIVENGSMNAERYISDILEDYVMPWGVGLSELAKALGPLQHR